MPHWAPNYYYFLKWLVGALFEILEENLCKKNSIFSLNPPLNGGLRAVAPAIPCCTAARNSVTFPVQEMSISLQAHSASPSDLSTGGVGVLRPWKNKPPTGMTVSSLPSSNLDHTHTRVESRSVVPDQCLPDWRRMRCWPCGDQMALQLLQRTQEFQTPTTALYDPSECVYVYMLIPSFPPVERIIWIEEAFKWIIKVIIYNCCRSGWSV